jgi:hypothetical protein
MQRAELSLTLLSLLL